MVTRRVSEGFAPQYRCARARRISNLADQMTGQPVPPDEFAHDPLGPAPHDPLGPSNPHPRQRPSWLKKQMRYHGRKWMLGGGALIGVLSLSLLTWSIIKTFEVYGSPSPTATSTPVVPQRAAGTQHVSRAIAGPVCVQLDVGRLFSTQRVVLLRDVHKILEGRLRQQGLEVQSSADNVIRVHYEEMRGDAVQLVQAGNEDETLSEVPTVKTHLQVIVLSGDGALILGEKTVGSRSQTVTIERNLRGERSRIANSLQQQVYSDSMSFLKRVELPVPK